jgi:hypothetical protein
MRRILGNRPSPSTLVMVVALLIAAGGIAYASIPGPSGVIRGCYTTASPHALQVIDSGDRACPGGTTALTWNSKGPAGPNGPQGPQGPPGPSFARGTFHNSYIPLGKKGKKKTVATLRVPAPGSYAVTAKVEAYGGEGSLVVCSIKADYYGEKDSGRSGHLDSVARDMIPLQMLASWPELILEPKGGKITLKCSNTGQHDALASRIKLMAIAVGGYISNPS